MLFSGVSNHQIKFANLPHLRYILDPACVCRLSRCASQWAAGAAAPGRSPIPTRTTAGALSCCAPTTRTCCSSRRINSRWAATGSDSLHFLFYICRRVTGKRSWCAAVRKSHKSSAPYCASWSRCLSLGEASRDKDSEHDGGTKWGKAKKYGCVQLSLKKTTTQKPKNANSQCNQIYFAET